MTVKYEAGTNRIAINKEAICEEFQRYERNKRQV